MQITVKSPKTERELTIDINCPEGLEAKIEAWGADAVNSLAERMFTTDVGNKCRVMLNEGKEEAVVLEYAASYLPGVKRVAGPKKVTAKQAAAALPQMSPAELKALLEAATAALAAAEANG